MSVKTWPGWRAAALMGLVLVMFAGGCATNPVTKRREFRLVSEQKERELGEKNYGAYQQMQGGAYAVEPSVSTYVQGVGSQLWRVSDRPHLPYEIVVLNNSVPNAWAMPGGKMAVNRGLLTEMGSEAELAAVLSHEIVHVAAGHGANSMERGMVLQGMLIGVGLLAKDHDAADLIVGGSGVAAGLVSLKYSRGDELEADRYGMEYMVRAGYDPAAAVDMQETFLKLTEGKDSNWLAGLLSSHPPTRERVDKNRETAALYPPGGRMGVEEYARAMEPLVRSKPAYAALEDGYKALAANKPDVALARAEDAMRIEPREAHFHNLAAKAYGLKGDSKQAREQLDRAIALNDKYFEYYLQRGKLRQAQGDTAGARTDLERSLRLLPTASANYQLGAMARDAGRPDLARGFFRTAASSASAEGQKAAVQLAVMELPEQPEQYLRVQTKLDGRGFCVVTVQNTTPVDVRTCALGVYSPLTKRWATYEVPQGVPARRSASVATRVGPFADGAAAQGVRVRFERVTVK